MFNFRQGSYRHDVLLTMGTLLGDDSGEFRRSVLRSYPGMETAIKRAYEEKQNKAELAVTLAQLFLAEAIDKTDDQSRKFGIAKRIRAWLSSGGVSTFRDELADCHAKDIDGFELRLKWALSSIAAMESEKQIEEGFYNRVVGELLGALDGLSADERQHRRWIDIFEIAKPILRAGEDDNSPLMAVHYEITPKPKLSGLEVDVDIIQSPQGLLLRRIDNRNIITERRKLSQEVLRKIPKTCQKYAFINLTTGYNEIYSCIIVEPGGEVFGDRRAFWWALAKNIATVTEAEANGARMTELAFMRVSTYANSMWRSAIKESPIEDMRDQILPMRNIHLQAITSMIDNAEDKCGKLGLKIALAMVLAVQAEDEKLERYAYNSFKRFLWAKGEEPEEFWCHEEEDT